MKITSKVSKPKSLNPKMNFFYIQKVFWVELDINVDLGRYLWYGVFVVEQNVKPKKWQNGSPKHNFSKM